MKAQDIANIFANQYPPSLINKKRLTLSKDEPLFIFVTGHGGDYYFKMR